MHRQMLNENCSDLWGKSEKEPIWEKSGLIQGKVFCNILLYVVFVTYKSKYFKIKWTNFL